MLKLTAMTAAGPRTAMSRPRPLRGLNPTAAQTASLTMRNGESDGECNRDDRNGDADQRCDVGVRQGKRNGKRKPVRDGQVEHNLSQGTVSSRWRWFLNRSSPGHRFSSDSY